MTKLTPADGLYSAHARRDDDAAIVRLLAPLPAPIAANVRQGLAADAGSFTGMRHDAPTRRAIYIRANAEAVSVFTLPACTLMQAAEIWLALRSAEPRVTEATIVDAYRTVTGRVLDRAH